MFWVQTDLFVQLSEHGLFRRFSAVDAALWKLPRVSANALTPKHLIFMVEQNDADVGSEPVSVKHN